MVSCAIPAIAIPWFASTLMSYFRLWPILARPASGFEERAKRAEHPLLVELLGRAGIAVGEGNVRPFAGRDREGDPDDARIDVVEAGGLGVERDEVRRADALHPPLEGLLGQHRLVRRLALGGGRRVFRGAGLPALFRPVQELAEQRAELEPAIERLEGGTVRPGPGRSASGSSGTSTSRRIVTSRRESCIWLSTAPFGDRNSPQVLARPCLRSRSALSLTPSSEPYAESHLTAVFGPTLGTPGTLSTVNRRRGSGSRRCARAGRRTAPPPPPRRGPSRPWC